MKAFNFWLASFFFVLPCSGMNQLDQEVLSSLTLDQKIGQLFMVAASSNTQNAEILASNKAFTYNVDPKHTEMLIKRYHIGGLIFFGKGSPVDQVKATNYYQSIAKHPLLIAQDLEWGLDMRHQNVVRFPCNLVLGAIENPQLIYRFGREVGRQCKEIGVHINFAPVVDINNNPNNPVIGTRSFGENKERVALYGILAMQGMRDEGVGTSAKHFTGHGDVDIDSHISLPTVPHDKKRLESVELFPFSALMAAGVSSVMTAHLKTAQLDDQYPVSLSKKIVTDWLRKKYRYEGLIITDALGMGGVTEVAQPGEIELLALKAGNDILLCPLDVPKAFEMIKKAVQDGEISEQEIDEHVLRIFGAKRFLLSPNKLNPENLMGRLNTADAFQLKKELYRSAATLLRNNLTPSWFQTAPLICISLNDEDNVLDQFFSRFKKASHLFFDMKTDSMAIEGILNGSVHNPHEGYLLAIAPGSYWSVLKNKGQQVLSTLISYFSTQDKPVVLAVFDSPYILHHFTPLHMFDTVVVGYEDDEDAQEAVQDILLGNLDPVGKLPISLSEGEQI
jgi:beta-N-acetylhexosaminidase